MGLRTRKTVRDKEGHDIIIEGSTLQEYITILYMYTSNDRD